MSFLSGLGPKIKSKYAEAVKDQDGGVIFTESEVVELDDEATGIPFEVRYCPALAKKPTSAPKEDSQEGDKPKPKDVFAPPYQPLLYVTEDTIKEAEDDEGEQFVVLLNKFCVTPRHFLLVTKEFVPQTSPLTPPELTATYTILKQLSSREKHLAFFNSGINSGASQPHKHVQFIPLQNGLAPFDDFIATHTPQDKKAPFQLPLPYASFTALIQPPDDPSRLSTYLGGLFLALLDLMIDHLRRLAAVPGSPYERLRLSNLSYNVVMTSAYLHVVPRTKEKWVAPAAEGQEGGEVSVSVNSLGFAGMVLVKTEAELEAVKKAGVVKVLEEVGYPPVVEGELPEGELME